MKFILIILAILGIYLFYLKKNKYELILNGRFWIFVSWMTIFILYFFSGIKYKFNLNLYSFGYIILCLAIFFVGQYIVKKNVKENKIDKDEKNKIEVTFIIPVRIDSKERESNLDWLIERLSRRRNTFILLLEADTESRYLLKAKYENVKYCFVRDNDPVFYRTHYLNQLLRMADTSIVGIWDTDVVLSEKQIEESILTIYENRSALCYPYNGMYCSLSMQGSLLLKEAGISSINSLSSSDILSISTSSVGGAFFVNRNLYLQLGGENEFFYGWGCEDLERYKRLEILCQPVYRVAGPLYHLYHPRKENSWYQNEMLELSNRQEFLKVCGMSCEELKQYVQSWKWISVK